MPKATDVSWSPENLKKTIAILRTRTRDDLAQTIGAIAKALKGRVTRDGLQAAFARNGLKGPITYMRAVPNDSGHGPIAAPTERTAQVSDAILRILNRKGGATLEALCDAADTSPKRIRAELGKLRARGVNVAKVHDGFEIVRKNEITTVQKTGIAKVVGKPACAGVISDLHFGSRFCREDWIADCVNWLYSQGVRLIYVPGDITTGGYKHSQFELSAVGLNDQTVRLFNGLPQLPGLTYHGITGNHDDTFADAVGIDPGEYYVNFFKGRGRHDLFMYGRRGAFVEAQGVVVHMWHPRGSNPYARSYELQKKIEAYAPGQKPNIVLAGHRHFFAYVLERGVHAFACPTFEGSGSPFGNSLKSGCHFGGMLLRWELTRDGTMRNFSHTLRSYYENERPRALRA